MVLHYLLAENQPPKTPETSKLKQIGLASFKCAYKKLILANSKEVKRS